MNYIVISDNGQYKIAQVIESYKNQYQVKLYLENLTKKIKLNQVIYQIEDDIALFSQQLNQLIPQIDTQLLYELIDENGLNMHIHELAKLYFGENPSTMQTTSILFKLTLDNTLFHNYQDGYFRKYSFEEQQLRIQISQKQKLAQEEFDHYFTLFTQAIINNQTIDNINIDILKLLHKPDKHSQIYKALQSASANLKLSPIEICYKTQLIKDIAQFFTKIFIYDNFPNGIQNTLEISNSCTSDYQERLDLIVFSIDDTNTTEIDDAFSVEITANGYIIGVHIAAPALNSSLAPIVSQNISTVYFPGNKITMLPEDVIQHYSLNEGKTSTVVSIYFVLDHEFNILEYTSKINIVKIATNLRIETLETWFNIESIDMLTNHPYENELKILYKFALKLEEKRGKPSVNTLFTDYSFSFDQDKISIKPRFRGNPIDKLVSELMILANCSWGRLLTNAFIPAIYRVKQPNYPVKMTLTPDSHTGLNVDYYTWATSPLRRSSDYINQKQIISLICQTKDFYSATNPTLLSVVDNFDAKYSKYLDFQNKMEKYWSLKYLLQENINEVDSIVIYKSTVQLIGVPLEIDLTNVSCIKPKGTQLKLRIYNINLATLNFDFKLTGNSI